MNLVERLREYLKAKIPKSVWIYRSFFTMFWQLIITNKSEQKLFLTQKVKNIWALPNCLDLSDFCVIKAVTTMPRPSRKRKKPPDKQLDLFLLSQSLSSEEWLKKGKARFSLFCLQKCCIFGIAAVCSEICSFLGALMLPKCYFFKKCLHLIRKQMRKRPFKNRKIAAKRCVLQSLHWTSSTFEILFWLLSPNFVQFDQ